MTALPDAPAPHTGILASGVSKRFGNELALAPTDLVAAPGEVSLLVGENGSGKTTMLRILATLVLPDTGTVRINGVDPVVDGHVVRSQIGLALVNERSLFWRLTVLENLALFARARGVRRRERDAHCREVLDELGLADLSGRQAHALSAGQRQRAILGRALAGDPPVVLSDEPLRGLDESSERLVIDALLRRAEAGRTVVVATPSLREYGPLGDASVTAVGEGAEARP